MPNLKSHVALTPTDTQCRLDPALALADAREWATSATPAILKVYAFAAYEAMQPEVQSSFRAYVQRDGYMRSLGPIFAEAAAEYRAERDRRQRRSQGVSHDAR